MLNPWLTCAPRGVDPPCPACRAGDLNLCWSFTKGELGPGVHVGVTTDAPGAWADLLAAHDSMLIPVPDAVPDDLAVLADPFAVSMHAIVRHPPPPGGKVARLRRRRARRHERRRPAGAVPRRGGGGGGPLRRPGATWPPSSGPRWWSTTSRAWPWSRSWPAWSGGVLHTPFDGLPVAHPGGIDVVYDTIAKPETLEVGVRVLAERGTLVQSGVSTPGRWEWTPDLLQGAHHRRVQRLRRSRRSTGCASTPSPTTSTWSPRAASTSPACSPTGSPSSTGSDALRALARQDESGAIKVAFEPRPG